MYFPGKDSKAIRYGDDRWNMRKLFRSFNDLKLRNKFLILYVLCVFIPIIYTNIVFYTITTDNIRQQKLSDVNLVLDQVADDFSMLVDQAIGVSLNFYTDVRLNAFFDQDYDTTIDYVENYNLVLRQYRASTPLYSSIQEVSFYTDNPSVVYAGGVHPIHNGVSQTEWYQKLSEVDYPFLHREQSSSNQITFSVYRNLDFYYSYDNYNNILRIELNPVSLSQVFHNVTLQGNVYLLNENDEIAYTNDSLLNWRREVLSFDDIEIPNGKVMIEERYVANNYAEGWRIVGIVKEEKIMEDLYESRRFILILGLINFLLPTVIIVFISKTFHTRLKKILNHMKKIEKQKFEEIPYNETKDEIGELTSQFNSMTRKINTLFNEVYVANLQKKDLEIKEKQAQLSALQSQINPHFLFNALETIRMRSIIKGEEETAKIIQNMAKIFRNSLTWGRDWVPLENELALIHCFLEIQQYRFGDKLSYNVDFDPEVRNCVIPNLSFLPFVENASIHGIEALKSQGFIDIKIRKVDEGVEFTIKDNGIGISKERLNQIMTQLKNEGSMGDNVGIQNVYYRLKLYYEKDFYFSINSEPGLGTTVKVILACKKE